MLKFQRFYGMGGVERNREFKIIRFAGRIAVSWCTQYAAKVGQAIQTADPP
jgi:hypothetical protein